MGLLKEFRDFAVKGNAVDMAVGIILGAAFGKVVTSLVEKVMMPPLGMITGGVDFSDKKIVLQSADVAAKRAEVAVSYGDLINALIGFVIVAFALFMIVKAMNTARKRFEKQEEAKAAAPATPPADVLLLTEIRDLLRQGRGG